MTRSFALVLAAILGLEAPAQAGGRFITAAAPVRASGIVAPVIIQAPNLSAGLLPSLSAPALGAPLRPIAASVAAPGAQAAIVSAAPAAVAAASARETLKATEASLSETPGQAKSAEGGWTAGRSAFDMGAKPSGGAGAVSLGTPSGHSRGALGRPSLSANQVSGRAAPEAPRSGVKVRAFEAAETAFYGGGAALLSGVLVAVLGGSLWLAPAMGVASHLGSRAMFEVLGGLRGVVVDGWQASHDQRYRVGGDGRLRDVRGHKYGADRFERYAPGSVGTTASSLIRAAAFAAGAAWLAGAGLAGYALYAGVFVGLEILAARSRARAARDAGPVSEEGRAHAARFNRLPGRP